MSLKISVMMEIASTNFIKIISKTNGNEIKHNIVYNKIIELNIMQAQLHFVLNWFYYDCYLMHFTLTRIT